MYRSILVPLDGSPLSEYALPTAYDIACRSGATLGLLHVHECATPTPIYVEGIPAIDQNLLSLSKTHELAYLERIRDRLTDEHDLLITVALIDPFNADIRDQTIATMLATHATATNTDLIVMTTHGRGGLARFWLGSVADVLIRASPVPVLLLRPGEAIPKPDRPRPHSAHSDPARRFAAIGSDCGACFGAWAIDAFRVHTATRGRAIYPWRSRTLHHTDGL